MLNTEQHEFNLYIWHQFQTAHPDFKSVDSRVTMSVCV
jgi:hypothetical protein